MIVSPRLTLGCQYLSFVHLRYLKENFVAPFGIKSRGLRYWYKRPNLPFPPNYYKSHQVFYPPLEAILREKDLLENGIKLINIGVDEIPQFERVSRREARLQRQAASNTGKAANDVNLTNIGEEDILKILEVKEEEPSFSYDKSNHHYIRSQEGIKSITELAHHYAIFEHLFSTHSVRGIDKTLPTKAVDYWPQVERKWTEEEISKYSPGSRRIDPPPTKDIKYFYPVVPMNIEFAIEEDSNSEDLAVSPVYRGNHIKPKYSQAKPDIVIDAGLLNGNLEPISTFENLTPGGIKLIGDKNHHYSLALFNLDSQFGSSDPLCHWMVSNIHVKSDGTTGHDEVITFIPPYAFRGFGYHRYVFLLLQQKAPRTFTKIDDIDLSKRLLDPNKLIDEEGAKPVGLSWFQSSWDESCRNIFHNVLGMREPTYEYIQPKEHLVEQCQYPESAPFNVYLDAFRDPKEMNKEVLLERLKEVNPLDYRTLLKPSKLPPNIHSRTYESNDRFAIPSWMWTTVWKKRNKLGRWRLLRNPSAIQPLNNNADLDYPIWPHSSKLRYPMRYPWKHGCRTPIRETKWALPLKDHPSLRIEDEDIKGLRREELKEDLEDLARVERKE